MNKCICLSFVLLLILWIAPCSSVRCSTTRLNLIGSYTLGRQDELNKTFTKMGEKITLLEDVTFKVNDNVIYKITQARPKFIYNGSEQKAKIISNDIIFIEGGRLTVEIDFKWQKEAIDSKKGIGHAIAISAPIIFIKNITIIDNTYYFGLLDFIDIDILSSVNLTEILPEISKEDRSNLLRLLNDIKNVRTIRLELESQINRRFGFILKHEINSEDAPTADHFDYLWVPGQGKPNTTITITRRGVSIDVDVDGMILQDDLQIKGDRKQKCPKRNVPDLPLNIKYWNLLFRSFGDNQELISLDFYQKILRYAINIGLLDIDLNKKNWGSKIFKFQAGDLYQVFPIFLKKFPANASVNGSCQPANLDNLKITNGVDNALLVKINFDCKLYIQQQYVFTIGVVLNLEIEGVPKRSSLDFRIKSSQNRLLYIMHPQEFKMVNDELAYAIVSQSLSRLGESRLFGCGFPLYPDRENPHFETFENYTLIYDKSHVEQ